MSVRETIKKIVEEQRTTFSYSSTQIKCSPEIANKVTSYFVNEEDLHYFEPGEGGKEQHIHCTVLYGLHANKPEPEFVEFLSTVEPFEITLGKISFFDTNPEFDVMKIEVHGDELHKLHNELSTRFENTQTFPEYNPHITIAYVKKGYDRSVVDENDFMGINMLVNYIEFSGKDGNLVDIYLKSE